MAGLYQKALGMKHEDEPSDVMPFAETGEESGSPDDGLFDKDSGLSKEDQKEILSDIDKLAKENQIQITPEVFNIKAIKRGVLFPIIVNIMAITALAAGIAILAFFFKKGEEQLTEDTSAIASTEGKLLQELKRESEAKLQEKSQEISQINAKLLEIDKERQDLATNMESQIQARELELRSALEAEIEAERQQLQQQGVAEQDIQARIAALESIKTTEYNQQLEDFRLQAEQERSQVETNLRDLQNEYNQILSQTEADRQRLQDDAEKREEGLRTQLAEKEKALASSRSEAEAELAKVAQQKDNEAMVNNQIIGFYNAVKENIQSENFNQALNNLTSIRSYMNEDRIVGLPGIQQRREVEFFVIDSLTQLVRGEITKEEYQNVLDDLTSG